MIDNEAEAERLQAVISEMVDNLNGYEEHKIIQHFGDIDMTVGSMPLFRALVFVEELRRDEVTDKAAKHIAMKMTQRGITEFLQAFKGEVEPFPEEPVTEAGKDDSPPD